MKLLMRSTDPILLGIVGALLRDRGLACVVFDRHTSLAEGSIGVLPQRLMIQDEDEAAARRVLIDGGFAHELVPQKDA